MKLALTLFAALAVAGCHPGRAVFWSGTHGSLGGASCCCGGFR